MKHKVSELEGMLLDAAVAKAEGVDVFVVAGVPRLRVDNQRAAREAGYPMTMEMPREWNPSTDWRKGGPIIERERIELRPHQNGQHWDAVISFYGNEFPDIEGAGGPTPLIAAMRAYVVSEFGEEVELP